MAGHIYFKDENGNVFTNSKETYRGVAGSTFISHGEWADGEVAYDGELMNANDPEDYMWGDYVYDCQNDGVEPSEEGFETWIEEQGGADYVRDVLDEILAARHEI